MMLEFTKMQGLGNDFVVFNAIDQTIDLTLDQYRLIADRHLGIGCDQILLVEPARNTETDFYYRIINADGTEVEQCGNGARCFARYVRDKGLWPHNQITVGTLSGPIHLQIEDEGHVTVNMGAPVLEPELIPFHAESQATSYPLEVAGETFVVGAVSMGNPHTTLRVESVAQAPVETLGPLIENHIRFPQRVNVGFMEVRSREHIRLRVFERGTGETQACGTGACAAMVAGRIQGLLDEQVSVHLPGGELMIKWQGENQPVWMSGLAVTVFEGKLEL